MTQQRFLITGATGDTGKYAIQALIRQGHLTRAFVHREDERAQQLREAGAEVVIGDLLNIDDVKQALQDVSAAYFIYPIHPGLIQASAYFAQAAKESGVSAIVNMSQISARRDLKSHAAQDHWIGERLFDRSGVPITHLRPTLFAQWLLYPPFRRTIAEDGMIALPLGAGQHAPIAAEDQARLIAAILVEPGPHQGRTYTLHGPMEMNQARIASAVGEALGREVKYQPIDIDQYRSRLEAAKMSSFLVQHLCAIAIDYQNGLFAGTDSVIEQVTGQAPMTVHAFVHMHRDKFDSARVDQENAAHARTAPVTTSMIIDELVGSRARSIAS